MVDYNRIGVIVTVTLSMLVGPLAVPAQPPAKIPRIGMLLGGSPDWTAPSLEAFRQRLRELGYVEGHTLAIEYRFAEGKTEPLPALAAELVHLPVDILVTWGTVAARAAQELGHRHAERACLDVDQRVLDRRDRLLGEPARGLAGDRVQQRLCRPCLAFHPSVRPSDSFRPPGPAPGVSSVR